VTFDDVIERIKKELNEFEIGGQALDEIFYPLIEACSKVARNNSELKQCIEEGLSTVKAVVRKLKL